MTRNLLETEWITADWTMNQVFELTQHPSALSNPDSLPLDPLYLLWRIYHRFLIEANPDAAATIFEVVCKFFE